jgi:hypothetical protein
VAEKLAHLVDVADVLVELPGGRVAGEVKGHVRVEPGPRRRCFEDPVCDAVVIRLSRVNPFGIAGIDPLRLDISGPRDASRVPEGPSRGGLVPGDEAGIAWARGRYENCPSL